MIELLLAAALLTPGHEPVTICHNNRTITIDRMWLASKEERE